jgi:hypothetical protein
VCYRKQQKVHRREFRVHGPRVVLAADPFTYIEPGFEPKSDAVEIGFFSRIASRIAFWWRIDTEWRDCTHGEPKTTPHDLVSFGNDANVFYGQSRLRSHSSISGSHHATLFTDSRRRRGNWPARSKRQIVDRLRATRSATSGKGTSRGSRGPLSTVGVSAAGVGTCAGGASDGRLRRTYNNSVVSWCRLTRVRASSRMRSATSLPRPYSS